MSRKTNLKSIRLSDEIMEYINGFEGEGFNQKFENIIIFAMKTEVERRKRLEELEKLIKSRSEQLENINKDLDSARRATNVYKNVMSSLRYI